MKRALIAVVAGIVAVPSLANAQVNGDYLYGIFRLIEDVLTWAVPILIGLAFVWFLYNVFAYMIKTDPEGKEGARKQMIYGIIGLAIMVAVWGLVRIVTNFFGVSNSSNAIPAPKIPGLGN